MSVVDPSGLTFVSHFCPEGANQMLRKSVPSISRISSSVFTMTLNPPIDALGFAMLKCFTNRL